MTRTTFAFLRWPEGVGAWTVWAARAGAVHSGGVGRDTDGVGELAGAVVPQAFARRVEGAGARDWHVKTAPGARVWGSALACSARALVCVRESPPAVFKSMSGLPVKVNFGFYALFCAAEKIDFVHTYA